MLSTKDMSAGSGRIKPVMGSGNNVIKINSITFDVTPYDPDAYNIVLHVEGKPEESDFQGFLKDVNNPNGPRYEGQVGRVRFSPYPYKDTTLPSGIEIKRDNEVLKAMIFLSEVLNKREDLDKIEAKTIEEFMVECNNLFSNSEFFNACIGGREWENKDGSTYLYEYPVDKFEDPELFNKNKTNDKFQFSLSINIFLFIFTLLINSSLYIS